MKRWKAALCAPLLVGVLTMAAQAGSAQVGGGGEFPPEALVQLGNLVGSRCSGGGDIDAARARGVPGVRFEVRLLHGQGGPDRVPARDPVTGRRLYLDAEAAVENGMIACARIRDGLTPGRKRVQLVLRGLAARRLAHFAENHVGRQVAEVLDGDVSGVFQIQGPVSGEVCALQGEFLPDEAERIAKGILAWEARNP